MNPLLSLLSRYTMRLAGNRLARAPRAIASAGRTRQRTRLCLETLEDRTVPTTSISIAGATINEIGNVSAFVAASSGGLNQPKDLVQGPDGNVYVASYGTNSVIRYTPTGALLGTFVAANSGGLSSPYGLAFGPDGNLYVSSVTSSNILEYNGSTGAFLSTFVAAGSGGLNNAAGLVFGQDGNLYVSSTTTQSIDRFEGPTGPAPGSPLPAAGQSGATFVGTGSGGLTLPKDLTFGPDGNLYVASTSGAIVGITNPSPNNGVLEYNGTTGSFITTFLASGTNGVQNPRGLAFDQDGRLYVADDDIRRFDSQGHFLDDPVTGSAASASSLSPLGMVFDAKGALLVSNSFTNSVVQYNNGVLVTLSAASTSPVTVQYATADGTAFAGTDYTAQTGTVTFVPGQTSRLIPLVTLYDATPPASDSFSVQLSNPTGGATIANGNAIVTIVQPALPQLAISNASAIEGDPTAHYRGAFAYGTSTNSFNPVTFGPDGNLYTAMGAGPGQNTIQRYNGTTGAFMGTFATGPINGVRTIVFHDGYMYVASEYTNQVLQYNATTGAYVGVFVATGSGGINGPYGMAFDSAGNLYVSGRNSNNVVKYDTNGNPVGTYIAAGSGGLGLPQGIAFDPSGTYLYVASSGGANAVLKYNAATGAYVGVAASEGVGTPTNVTFGPDGLLYVSSRGNNRILRYTENGTYVDDYIPAGSGGLAIPKWMAFGPNGDLFVSAGSNQIFEFGTESEALFTVSLSTAFALPTTVNYSTANGTAIAGTNYTAASGTLTFAPGVTSETIRVPILDSGSQTAPLTFMVTLSNPEGATLSRSQATGTIEPSDIPAKFYVVDLSHTTFKYQASGTEQAPFLLSLGNLDSKGIAANAAGTKEWVVDSNENVYVYSPGGSLLGSWAAGGLPSGASLNGIATDGTNIWLLDATTNKIFEYTGAASRLSGSQNAASNFKVNSSDRGPANLVTDGASIWTVDNGNGKVFKYTVAGSLLGSWKIDPADLDPVGITIDPNNVSNIWIVDDYTLKVYQYTAAASRTSGSQNAAATFALASGDTNPQGIADPPPADTLITPAVSSLALMQPSNRAFNAAASSGVPTIAAVPSLAGRDAVFSMLARESLLGSGEPSNDFMAGGALTSDPESSTVIADRALTITGIAGGQESVDYLTTFGSRTSEGSRSENSAVGLVDSALAGEGSQMSAAETDLFASRLEDDVPAGE